MFLDSYLLLTIAVLFAAGSIFLLRQSRSLPVGTRGLPPGPKGFPLVGNLLDLPPFHIWLKFKEWSDVYGPIFRLNLAGNNHVVVSTEKIANDLLTKRGAIYSSRGGFIALSEYFLNGEGIIDQPYNDRLRRWRKFFHDVGRREALETYQELQQSESVRLVKDIVDRPEDYDTAILRFTHALMYRLVVNKSVKTGSDAHVVKAQERLHDIEKVGKPGAYLVDILPFLRYVPEFMAPWKREIRGMRERFFAGSDEILLEAMGNYQRLGKAAPKCWMNDLLANQDKYSFSHGETRMVIDASIGAGAGTTGGTLMSLILAMILYPQWQEKAQKEIDSVVGGRIPDFSDLPQLPTVRAVVKETLRWRPVTGGGVPHLSTKDDVYEGYFIPAGSQVHANQWAIHREPSLYPDGEDFKPDRWLSQAFPTFQAPLSEFPNLQGFSAFGFGRRICPGLNFAEQSLYIATAMLLWACRLSKKIDSTTGKEVFVPDYDYTTEGFNTQPKPFHFTSTWRDPEKSRLINEALMAANGKNGS